MLLPLPIDEHVARVRGLLRAERRAVLVAPAGAGKTTRVPPALVPDGPVFLLQPRRVAARSIARRIAEEQGWTVGREVGWQVRFEREFCSTTRLLVATEGVLNARLLSDPLLAGFRTVVLDEFHERSIHADLAIAFLREALEAREDLRLLVMSATVDAGRVTAFLGDCPVVVVEGRPHPVEIRYAPGVTAADGVRQVVSGPGGHVLCFLPGAGEIRWVQEELGDVGGRLRVLPLHGTLDSRAQDAALAATTERKVVLATNVAETSLTVEGVTDVVDTGLQKVMRYDEGRGIDRLALERVPFDSAEQRAGRAGRTAPGRAVRLWDPRDRLRPHHEAEILRVDLTAPLLDVIAWGADPLSFRWFEAPARERVASALDLLRLLGAIQDGRLTDLGNALRRLPLHPRLGRVLVEAGGSFRAAACVAVLSERRGPAAGDGRSTDSDLLSLVDRLDAAPLGVRQAARELEAIARRLGLRRPPVSDDTGLRRALLAGFPDRVARRREPGSARLLMASGTGAVLARESGVHDGEFVLALDVVGGPSGPASEALVRMASRVERDWLAPTRRETVRHFDPGTGSVRATERASYLGLLLMERSVPVDPQAASPLLVEALLARGLGPEADALIQRASFAGVDVDVPGLVEKACEGRTRVRAIDLEALLPRQTASTLERLAPKSLAVPSGRRVALDYRADGSVVASVKLQEVFGLKDSPRVGPGREPIVFELLAPNGRPVQKTRDLRGFWQRTYPDVRKELRGRYPRHPWPEDPWTAEPTHRTKRRR